MKFSGESRDLGCNRRNNKIMSFKIFKILSNYVKFCPNMALSKRVKNILVFSLKFRLFLRFKKLLKSGGNCIFAGNIPKVNSPPEIFPQPSQPLAKYHNRSGTNYRGKSADRSNSFNN